eukprot:1176878-Prymnesium_polylepis.1
MKPTPEIVSMIAWLNAENRVRSIDITSDGSALLAPSKTSVSCSTSSGLMMDPSGNAFVKADERRGLPAFLMGMAPSPQLIRCAMSFSVYSIIGSSMAIDVFLIRLVPLARLTEGSLTEDSWTPSSIWTEILSPVGGSLFGCPSAPTLWRAEGAMR